MLVELFAILFELSEEPCAHVECIDIHDLHCKFDWIVILRDVLYVQLLEKGLYLLFVAMLFVPQSVLYLLRVEKTEESVDAAQVETVLRSGFYAFEEEAKESHGKGITIYIIMVIEKY